MKGQANPIATNVGKCRSRSRRPQVGLMTGVRDYSTGELKHNVVALRRQRKR